MPGGGHGGGNHAAALSATVSDLKQHRIGLALGAFSAEAPRDEQPAALVDSLFTECWTYRGVSHHAGLLGLDGGDSLVPAFAVCEAKKTWTLRLHETLGRRGVAHLRLAEGYTATPTDLRGNPLGNALDARGTLPFTPYAVMSLRVARL